MDKASEPAVASPCNRQCCLDQRDICVGCFRRLEDILRWGQASDDQKREMLAQAKQRKAESKIRW